MHIASKWRDQRINAMPLDYLTLTDVHLDDRYKWKTLPSMKTHGLNYPLVCFTANEKFYWDRFWKACPDFMKVRLPPPAIVNGIIYMIKGGNNRYQSANELGYTSIDCMIFEDQKDAIKWMKYLDQCDPLNHPYLEFLGLIDYK